MVFCINAGKSLGFMFPHKNRKRESDVQISSRSQLHKPHKLGVSTVLLLQIRLEVRSSARIQPDATSYASTNAPSRISHSTTYTFQALIGS